MHESASWKQRFASVTDPGRERSENQDAAGSASTDALDFFFVCDGMGGHRAGSTAARLAVQTLSEVLVERAELDAEDRIRHALEASNTAILEAAGKDAGAHGMGTTAVVLAVDREHGTAVTGHVGDSRIYLIRDATVRQLTRDHTFVQRLVDDGVLDAAAAENHPQGNVIIRSLGGQENVDVELGDAPIPLRPGDTFLLCSDGLHGQLSASEIADIAAGPDVEAAAKQLVALANERGGPDNITVQIIRVGEREAESPEQWEIRTPPPAPGTRLALAAEAAASSGTESTADDVTVETPVPATNTRGDDPAADAGRALVAGAIILILVIAIALFALVRANAPEPVAGSPNSGASPVMPPP
jgi:protein phosphatase